MNLKFVKILILLWATWGVITLAASVRSFSIGNEDIPAPISMPKEGNQTAPIGISVDVDVLRFILIGFYAAGLAAIVYALIIGKMKAAKSIMIYFGGGLLAVTVFVILLYFSEDIKRGVDRFITTVSGGGGSGIGEVHTPAQTNTLLSLVILIVIVCAIVGYMITARLSRRDLPSNEGLKKHHARRVIDKAILEIIHGDDPRGVVIRCYNEMCILVAGKGIHGRTLTPGEFKVKIREELGVKGEAVDDLTSLFEEARYSHHFIGEVHRERALKSLRSFSEELGEKGEPE